MRAFGDELRADIKGEVSELRGELLELRDEVRGGIVELKDEVAELRGEFTYDFKRLRVDLRRLVKQRR